MARGWESKSVEAQIEERTSSKAASGGTANSEDAETQRNRANLLLSRKRILQQLEATTNERYSEMLRRSLAELDAQLGSQ
jgi:hypothetical protein